MSNQVKVEDLEVFAHFRAVLLKFAQAAGNSLSNADSQISRAHSWLESEQTNYWQAQLRKRTEAVTKARDAVRQKKLYTDSSGRNPSAIEEEKALRQCLAAVEEAQSKLEAIKRWIPRLLKEADHYRGGVSRLNKSLYDDVPRALALLDRLAASLTAYVELAGPSAGIPETAAPTVSEETMARGGTETAEAPTTHPPTHEGKEKKEQPHVPPGQ